MGWLIALGILCGLAFLPLGFRAIYRADNPGVWLLIGPVKIRVYPGKPAKEEKTKPEQKKSEASILKGGNLRDFLPVTRAIIDFLKQFRKKIRVNHLELQLTMAGDDPADVAINYGRAWFALENLMPHLERVFVIKKRNLNVLCDFEEEKTKIYARVDVTITLARTVQLLSCHGIKVIKELIELKKLRKGGAKL